MRILSKIVRIALGILILFSLIQCNSVDSRRQSDNADELKDINNELFDLTIPQISQGPPSAGKRVRQKLVNYDHTNVYHVLYLPVNWEQGKKYPVIVEYPGNGPYRSALIRKAAINNS